MKTYEALYEPDKNKGVYAISLVESPAMEGMFIALSKDTEIQFKEVDKEQRILTGLALEPNKPIYRNQNGEEFNIVFSEATIKELAFGFLKNGYQKNSSLEHENVITGVTFTESWIIEDSKNDKSSALGFDYPKGSWMVTMKVDDPKVWEDYVKTGKVQGFSIDAMLSLKEVNLKSEIKMSKPEENILIKFLTDLPDRIALALKGETKEADVKLGEIKSEDGNVTIMFDGETMEVGGKVWVWADDKTEVPLPVGDYKLEDGRILVVSEVGVISEVKEAAAEEEVVEQAPAEMTAKETDATARAIENAIKSIMIKYSEDNAKVLEEIKAEFNKQITELKSGYDKQILELSNQPASKPFKSAPAQSEPKTAKERILQTIQNQ